MSGALLLKLALHHLQHVALFLKGGGDPLDLLIPLLSLSKVCLHVLQSHVLTLSTSLHLNKGGVPQRELRPRLAKHRALPLKLLLFAPQHGAKLLGLFGLLLRRGVMSVALLLRTVQGTLLQAGACPHLVQLVAEIIYH